MTTLKTALSTFAAALALSTAIPAQAAVNYVFDFFDLDRHADFSISLSFEDYVTASAFTLAPIAGDPQLTSLGYSVTKVGNSNGGWWAFNDDTGNARFVADNRFVFDGSALLFTPESKPDGGFFTQAGVYDGRVGGNDVNRWAFGGSARLTITDTSVVPEPAGVTLLVAGLIALIAVRRYRVSGCKTPSTST